MSDSFIKLIIGGLVTAIGSLFTLNNYYAKKNLEQAEKTRIEDREKAEKQRQEDKDKNEEMFIKLENNYKDLVSRLYEKIDCMEIESKLDREKYVRSIDKNIMVVEKLVQGYEEVKEDIKKIKIKMEVD